MNSKQNVFELVKNITTLSSHDGTFLVYCLYLFTQESRLKNNDLKKLILLTNLQWI